MVLFRGRTPYSKEMGASNDFNSFFHANWKNHFYVHETMNDRVVQETDLIEGWQIKKFKKLRLTFYFFL